MKVIIKQNRHITPADSSVLYIRLGKEKELPNKNQL